MSKGADTQAFINGFLLSLGKSLTLQLVHKTLCYPNTAYYFSPLASLHIHFSL